MSQIPPSAKPPGPSGLPNEIDEIRLIKGVAEIEQVYRLTHDSYVDMSYSPRQANGLLLHYPEYDVIPETKIFVALQDTKIKGTVSITTPGPFGFTVDRDFPAEVKAIQDEGRNLCVIWRLAVDKTCRESRNVLLGLISAAIRLILAKGLNSWLFEVNPRHERVYSRLLNMRVIGRNSGAEGLKQAPAVLLRGDLETSPPEWRLSDQAPNFLDLLGLSMLDQILQPEPGLPPNFLSRGD